MNSLERVLIALNNKTPDKVPIMELSIDQSVIDNIMPGVSWLDFYENFDIDGVSVMYDLQYEDIEPNIKRDCFGILRNFKEMHGMFPTPVEPLINASMNPMEFLKTFNMPDPKDPRILAPLKDAVKKLKGKKAIAFMMHSSLIYPIFLRGFDNYMMDYYINPEFAYELAMIFTDWFIDLEKQAIHIGADLIIDGEDYSGKNGIWMSVDHLKKFVLPGLKKTIKVAKDAGIPYVKHCDGDLYPILDLLVEQGIDCLNPIEPAAGMDIGKVKKLIGHKVALWGNIDCSRLLTFGTPNDVRKATIECIKDASSGGGHIISSSNTIHDSVPAENFVTMVQTARRYGKYPLDL